MHQIKQHITLKLLAITLVLAVLLPAVIKFNHIFEDHKHEVCDQPQDTHFHNIDLDCEFYKFHLNTLYTSSVTAITFDITNENYTILSSQYQFVSDFQKLPFPLRGPPKLV